MTDTNAVGRFVKFVAGEEAVKGDATPTGTEIADYMNSISINPVQDTVEIGQVQSRDMVAVVFGGYHVEGSISQYVSPNGMLGFWLRWAVGENSTTGVGPEYTHTYDPDENLKTFAAYCKRTVTATQQILVNYGTVQSLKLTQANGDALVMDVSFVGQKDMDDTTDITAMVPPTVKNIFHSNNFTLDVADGGVDVFPNNKVINAELLIENEIDVGAGKTTDSKYNLIFPVGQRKVSGSFDIMFTDNGEMERFWGNAAGPTDDSYNTAVDLEYSWVLTAAEESLVINIPAANYTATTLDMNLTGQITQHVDWTAVYDATDARVMRAVLINATVDYP